jgi:hypothetical protein
MRETTGKLKLEFRDTRERHDFRVAVFARGYLVRYSDIQILPGKPRIRREFDPVSGNYDKLARAYVPINFIKIPQD